ncbi:MAG: hypothetical protein HY886_05660 [Deltaproteobacteria bacterium]|nr:hypothetical protein [Deltaproteobacteria bacterium]
MSAQFQPLKRITSVLSKLCAVVLVVLLSSCEMALVENQPTDSSARSSRFILYAHLTSQPVREVVFTIDDVALETADGTIVKALDSPVEVSSQTLQSGQMLLKEALVAPGEYTGLRIRFSKATITRSDGRMDLALPEGRTVVIKSLIDLRRASSFVFSIGWDPENSIEKAFRFQPAMIAEAQEPSSTGLLLLVSNSGSNYISLIDRSLERVTAAITVGDKPMGMALNPAQNTIYVVNSGSRTLSVVEAAHLDVLDVIPLTAGIGPFEVVFMPDTDISLHGKLYVLNRLSNDVAVINTITRRVMKIVPVGLSPSAIAVDTQRREVYVVNERSNSLSIINTVDDTVASTVPVDKRPSGIVLGNDKIYVLNEGAALITVVSPSTRAVTGTIPLAEPPRRGIKGFDNRLFIANATDSITFVNSGDVATRTIPSGPGPLEMAGDERRGRVYVTANRSNAVELLDPFGEKVVKRLYVGPRPYGLVSLER